MYFWLYCGLFCSTSGYAVLLERLKRRYPKIEPDWTWAEVVGGTSIVLAAPALLEWYGLITTARQSREAHWLAFLIGGLPVIIWQVWRMSHRHQEIIKVAQEEANGNNGSKNTAPTVADQSSLVAGGKRRPRRRYDRPDRSSNVEDREGD